MNRCIILLFTLQYDLFYHNKAETLKIVELTFKVEYFFIVVKDHRWEMCEFFFFFSSPNSIITI